MSDTRVMPDTAVSVSVAAAPERSVTPARRGTAAHHLRRRPRHGAQGPLAAATAAVAARARGPRVVQEKVRLHFTGGHYGFERNDPDGHWCDVWLFDGQRHPHRPAARSRRDAPRAAAQRGRPLRGPPPRHLRADRPARRHGPQPCGGGHQLSPTSSPGSAARASSSATTRSSPPSACASTTTG